MKLAVYQIDSEKDTERMAFMSYEFFTKHGQEKPDAGKYQKVYEGDVDCDNLEEVYTLLNTEHPDNYNGHSLSVSDIVEVKEQVGDTEPGFYFCDSFGFAQVEFDAEQACKSEEKAAKKNTMTVVLLEPYKEARIAEIGTSLKEMQATVGGDIEAFYPFEDEDVCMIVDEEGKLKGYPLNRAVFGEEHEMIEIVAGTAFICDCSGENFAGLNEEKQKKYQAMFRYPEQFFRMNGEIKAIPFKPEKNRDEAR